LTNSGFEGSKFSDYFSSLIPFSPFCAYAPETLKLSALTPEQLWNDLIVGGWLIQPK